MNILGFDVPAFVFAILAAALAQGWAARTTIRLQEAEKSGDRLEDASHQASLIRHLVRTRDDVRYACVLLNGVLVVLSAILAVLLVKL